MNAHLLDDCVATAESHKRIRIIKKDTRRVTPAIIGTDNRHTDVLQSQRAQQCTNVLSA